MAGLDLPELLVHRDQDHQVEHAEQQQEHRGHQGADQSAGFMEPLHVVLESHRRDGDGKGCQDHDGGMPQGKPGAHCNRSLALLHQFAGDIVDGCDVIGIHGVAQAEAVRQ